MYKENFTMIPESKERDRKEVDKNKVIRAKILDYYINNNEEVLREEDGFFIVDLDQFADTKLKNIVYSRAKKDGKVNRIALNRQAVFKYLSDLYVVSSEDYKSSLEEGIKPQSKKLFGVPASADDAFNPEKIKDKDYYLDYWGINRQNNMQWSDVIEAENGDKLNVNELYLATKIFRDFKGKRELIKDEKGEREVLLVLDKESGEHKPISIDWIFANIKRMGFGKGVHSYLLKKCPNLVARGLIKPEDFESFSVGPSNEIIRYERKANPKNKFISFKRAKYYIGSGEYFEFCDRKIDKNKLKFVELDGNTIGIVSSDMGNENIEGVIDMLSEEELSEKRRVVMERYPDYSESQIQSSTFVKADEIRAKTRQFDKSDFVFEKKDESKKDYLERVNRISDYKYIKEVVDLVSRESEVSAHQLSWREQIWLAAAYRELSLQNRGEELTVLAKKIDINGLRVFLSVESNIKNIYKILELGKKLDNEKMSEILIQYNKISDYSYKIDRHARAMGINKKDGFNSDDIETITRGIVDQANAIILEALHNSNSKEMLQDKKKTDLNKLDASIIFLNQIIKNLPREEVAELNLREVKNIERMENVLSQELLKNQELLDKIITIIKKQFSGVEVRNFLDIVKSKQDLRITVTLVNNEVISFFTKREKANEVEEVDWFVANPDAPIKGLGEATVKLGFTGNEDANKVFYLVAKPHVKSFQVAIEKLGFVSFGGATENDEGYEHHYARCRKTPEDSKLVCKNISQAELTSLAKAAKEICPRANKTESFIFKDKKLRVCKVNYHDQTYHDDISPEDPDGWLYDEIKKQDEKGYVMSRFISESDEKDNQVYFAIFEEDQAQEETINKIWDSLGYEDSNDFHSASKKARSN